MDNKIISSLKCKFPGCEYTPLGDDKDKYCIFHSKNPKKDRNLFREKFQKLIDDEKTALPRYSHYYSIDGFTFPEDFDFPESLSKLSMQFKNCTFNGRFNIFARILFGRIFFLRCTFKSKVIFIDSDFEKYVFFSECIFIIGLQLIGCRFNAFMIKRSEIEVHFYIQYSQFHYWFQFGQNKLVKNCPFILIGINFDISKRVQIYGTNLMNAFFFNCMISRIEFFEIEWKKGKDGRYLISNENFEIKYSENPKSELIPDGIEFLIGKKDTYTESVENIYSQLSKAYEKNSLFLAAERFYISKMEIRRERKKNWFKRYVFSPEALYKIFSDYGTSIKKTLAWILGIFFIFSILIQCASTGFSFDFFWSFSLKDFCQYFKMNLIQIIYPLDLAKGTPDVVYLLFGMERLFLISLMAFFLLSLKRRFREVNY